MPVLTFFAVTSTPGINAPEASETVPLRTALTWAKPELEAKTHRNTIGAIRIFFTDLSPCCPRDFAWEFITFLGKNKQRYTSEPRRMPNEADCQEFDVFNRCWRSDA